MRVCTLVMLAALLSFIGYLAPAHADETSSPLTAELSAVRVIMTQGEERFVPAETVRPGDTIEYRLVYTNNGADAMRDLTATLPIPQGMTYRAKTASPSAVHASLDGTNFAPIPLQRSITGPDGNTLVVDVPVEEYRYLRWRIADLPAKQEARFTARVRVRDSVPEQR